MEQSLSSYRIFNSVARNGNISKAAKELYISQPAISKSIQKLEESLGVKLFYRSSRGVTLTPEGEFLYSHVKSAFETLTIGEEKLRRYIALGVGNLTIGASSTLCKYILLPYLKGFIKKYPHINISIYCHSTHHTLRLLEEGKLDIGLVGRPETMKKICFVPLRAIEDIFVANRDYLRNQKALGTDRQHLLQNSTLLLLDKENMTRQHIDSYFLGCSLAIQDTIEVSNMDLLIEMSKIGLGIGCVIRDFVREDLQNGSLMEIPLNPPIPKREIGFAYNRDAAISKSLRHFMDFCGIPS